MCFSHALLYLLLPLLSLCQWIPCSSDARYTLNLTCCVNCCVFAFVGIGVLHQTCAKQYLPSQFHTQSMRQSRKKCDKPKLWSARTISTSTSYYPSDGSITVDLTDPPPG